MANPDHLATLKQGVEAWNRWRGENPDLQPNLDRANLIGANLSGVDFSFARLFGAKLQRADLSSAQFYRAILGNAHLTSANLTEAYLGAADLGGVDLQGATLVKTNLKGAYLGRAVLSKSNVQKIELAETCFGDTDLKDVRDLESCIFSAPCTIDLRTIAISWPLPASFLSGCGLSRTFTEYIPSLVAALQPIQFYSCFISHSSQDDNFARRLHSRMEQENLRVWFAPADLKGGEWLYDQIDQAIRAHDKLLLVLSPASMASGWVATEIERTRVAEKEQGERKLFPIRVCPWEEVKKWTLFDADSGRDLAKEVRSYYIPDFGNWKDHDAFEVAFAKLMENLKAELGE